MLKAGSFPGILILLLNRRARAFGNNTPRIIRTHILNVFSFPIINRGGTTWRTRAEEAPSTEAPEMSAEETQDMNDQMEMMKKMQESGGTESK
ncbi:MAG: hypothetical protein GY826_42420 [Fuerstiella sp.]|nr:hypothetical protein [Fuerstiella sp.]